MKYRKIKIYSLVAAMVTGFAVSCNESFLEQPPQGVFAYPSLTTKAGVDGMLINAYASLHGPNGSWYTTPINWVWGSVVAGEAYKGSDKNDQSDVNPIQRFEVLPSNPLVKSKWDAIYNAIGRANQVLTTVEIATGISDDEKVQIIGQARFLRGLNHLEAIKVFGNVPYVDETETEFKNSNESPIWDKVEEDFRVAYTTLNVDMGAVGRANKYAAGAYLAKTMLFQAKDNPSKYGEAKTILEDIMTNGKTSANVPYGLWDKFSDAFTIANENGKESIFGMQFSVGDGSTTNGNYEMTLAYPAPIFTGCCGFYQPSQNLINSYKTDASGLPLLDTYNDSNVTPDEKILSTTAWKADTKFLKDQFTSRRDAAKPHIDVVYKSKFGVKDAENIGNDPATNPDDWELVWTEPYTTSLDPRLDLTVGRRDVPYVDYGDHPGYNWIRDQAFAGPYSPKKHVFSAAERDAKLGGAAGWGWNNSAKNFVLMRFADVILMHAECEAEVGTLQAATDDVNRIRARAANPAGFVREGNDPTKIPSANYVIDEYPTFATKEFALKAIRFERKLELAMEGHRFYDLVRWGIVEQEMTDYLEAEGDRREVMLGGATFKPRNVYMPIPEYAITNSVKAGVATLKQNDGY